VFGLVAWWISNSEFWPAVQRQFFSWTAIEESFPSVLRGFWLNLQVWIIAEVFILVFALVLAVMRSLSGPIAAPLRIFAVAYIDLLRGVPALLLILLFGFGIPALQLPGLPRGALFWGSVAMIAGYSAYTAEVYRSGMEADHARQRPAARAPGHSQRQTPPHANTPPAIRNVLPALLNGAVTLQKDVPLHTVIGVLYEVG
jgi:polar amino acid transport system permease protein